MFFPLVISDPRYILLAAFFACMCMCVYTFTCMCVYIYTYVTTCKNLKNVCVYTHTYTHINTHTYIQAYQNSIVWETAWVKYIRVKGVRDKNYGQIIKNYKICCILGWAVLITVCRYYSNYQDIWIHFIFFMSSLVGKMTNTHKSEKEKSCKSSEVAREDFMGLNLGYDFLTING